MKAGELSSLGGNPVEVTIMSVSRPLLVATDGSPEARAAVDVGVELAARVEARVLFLHIDHAAADLVFRENPMRAPDQRRIAEVDPALREASALAQEKGVKGEMVLVGALADPPHPDEVVAAILGTADAEDVQAIVVGCRGRGAIASVLLGSVSQGVLERSSRRVVVVRDPRGPEGSAADTV